MPSKLLPPFQHPQPRGRGVQYGVGPVLPHSNTPSLRVTEVEDEDDDENSLPDEACGPIITPAEKSASQARRAPKIGERSREDEAPHEHYPKSCELGVSNAKVGKRSMFFART